MSSDQTLSLIEDYRSHSALWDIVDKDYTNKMKRNDAYTVLARKYNMTVKGVKNKIKSLRSYFSKEHQKVTEKKSGAGAEDKYESPWFAYKSMLFISDSITPRQTKESLTPRESIRSDEGNDSQVDIELHGTSEESNDVSTNKMYKCYSLLQFKNKIFIYFIF
ncbi:hypothetical protein NQ314_004220 [Rhamnusium bicolor]|uniref:MADF domain-containing protein n=1 Tax=Rhamnusium bicolor TaxID=1586634 RepID=A0AAV8ZKF6_9CUCU|nr:hypothetical protein NQ314_004220 [Rhamnusium bicolor]